MEIYNRSYVRSSVFLKNFVLALIFLSSLYFYLFYDLKCEPHVQNAISSLSNISSVQKYEEIIIHVGESECTIPTSTTLYRDKIIQLKQNLDKFYVTKPNDAELSKRYNQFGETLVNNNFLVTGNYNNYNVNIFQQEIQNYFTDGRLIKILKNSPLLKASITKYGKMLKLLFDFPNNFTAIFKPQWYQTNEILEGSPHWRGKDRHFGEVVAFYLSILLDFKNVPVTAIRKININKLSLITDRKFLDTFVYKNNRTCFYGVCEMCNPHDLLCADVSNIVEGSAAIYLPLNYYKLKVALHPWFRHYNNLSALWEIDDDYCTKVRNGPFFWVGKNEPLFFDMMDGSVFDFLIDNGDRHHCEYYETNGSLKMILFDNGKSFANPYIDHIDILAPLFQCCSLRNSTWNTLLNLRGRNLSFWLRRLLLYDPDIILHEGHFEALDRRLLIIFAVLEDCFERKGGINNVIIGDLEIIRKQQKKHT